MDIRLSKYATCMHPIESGIMCTPLDKLVNTDHIFQLANVLWHKIITVGKTSYYALANKTSNSYPSRLTHISTWMIRISEMAWHWWLDLQYGVYQDVTWPSDVTWESSIGDNAIKAPHAVLLDLVISRYHGNILRRWWFRQRIVETPPVRLGIFFP